MSDSPKRGYVVAVLVLATLAVLLLIPFGALAGTLGDAAVVAAASADLYSTHLALQRGGRELNTVSSLKGQAVMHVGVASAAILLAHQAERQGHRGWARAVRAVPVVIFGGAAIWNWKRGGR